VLSGDVFDENRMTGCCHLTNFSDIEPHSCKVPLQEGPILARRTNGSSGACNQTKTIWGIRCSVVEAWEVDGWKQPYPAQSDAWLRRQPANDTAANRFDVLLRCDSHR